MTSPLAKPLVRCARRIEHVHFGLTDMLGGFERFRLSEEAVRNLQQATRLQLDIPFTDMASTLKTWGPSCLRDCDAIHTVVLRDLPAASASHAPAQPPLKVGEVLDIVIKLLPNSTQTLYLSTSRWEVLDGFLGLLASYLQGRPNQYLKTPYNGMESDMEAHTSQKEVATCPNLHTLHLDPWALQAVANDDRLNVLSQALKSAAPNLELLLRPT